MGKLTAKFVESAKAGRHADGEGLYLLVKPTGARSWVLRVQVGGKRRDIGLGSVTLGPLSKQSTLGDDVPLEQRSSLTLAQARELATRLRNVAKSGADPAAEKKKDRSPPPSFKEAAKEAHKALKAGWSDKTADAFLSSLEEHAFPLLGNMRVDDVDASHIAAALKAIWSTKPSMAVKVRQRIGKVLDFAKAKRWRSSETPRHSVSTLVGKVGKGGNFAAMPYPDVPAFVDVLNASTETVGRLALLFTIATACRSGEARGATWGQVDWDRKEWHRPASLMRKTGVAHTVTLNDMALSVLRRAAASFSNDQDGEALIFPSARRTALSDMALSKIMKDAKKPYVPHGFRSSFRDWAAERMPQVPDAVAEAALAHTIPDAVVKAYKRTSFLQMRRELLDAWGDFLTGKKSNVIPLAERQA